MNKKEYFIIGRGGHAKVIVDLALKLGYSISGIFDDDEIVRDSFFSEIPMLGRIDRINNISNCYGTIAIGSNHIRRTIATSFNKILWKQLIHPSAIIGRNVLIGEGTVIMAGAIIQSGTVIGNHVIINTGACIDHDCCIENYVHVAPNCSLAGGIKIHEGAFIGIGASIIPQVKIGKWATIGAGSVIVDDFPDYCVAFGNPAKIVKFKDGAK